MDKDKIKDYKLHRDEYANAGRGATFRDAVQKIDEYILDPVVCQIEVNRIFIYIYLHVYFYVTEFPLQCIREFR